MSFSQYTNKSSQETLKLLKTRESGLNSSEVLGRQKEFGKNALTKKELRAFVIFFRQLKSPLVYLLFVAAAISFFMGEAIDGFTILAIIFLNAILGFIQEYKSEKTIQKLENLISSKVLVRRENKEEVIKSSGIVPGDVVILRCGDIVPADLRVIQSENLAVSEENLTGEVYPVEKNSETLLQEERELTKSKNILFTGAHLTSGKAEGVVLAIARQTVMGEIARKSAAIEEKSSFEKYVDKFSKFILKTTGITLILLFIVVAVINHFENLDKFLLFAIALSVGIIPEALPLITAFTLSRGAAHLAKHHVVVKKLAAIEDLGNIEVLCTDKTGTITQSTLEVDKVEGSEPQKIILYSLLASSVFHRAKRETVDPFDAAISKKADSAVHTQTENYEKIWEQPFNPVLRYNAALVLEKSSNKKILIVRGAAESLFKMTVPINNLAEISQKIEKYGEIGHRSLICAYKEIGTNFDSKKDLHDLIYAGFLIFLNPLKSTSCETITKAKKLGVDVKILTGDDYRVARYIGQETGIMSNGEKVYTGEELAKLSTPEFEKAVFKNHIFARCNPDQKYRILETIKKKKSVGFLGEGINDAPSLKLADVGLVVEGGADVSREVGDIILLRNDLRVIIDSIVEGRKIFANIEKYIKVTLIGNFGNYYAMAVFAIILPFLPMLPVQILLLNLLSDFPAFGIASDSVDPEETRRPEHYNIERLAAVCVILGLVSTFFDFVFFGFFYKTGPDFLRTMWFIESILTEIFVILSLRSRRVFWKASRPSFPLLALLVFTFFATILIPFSGLGKVFHFVRPTMPAILLVLAIVITYFFATEIVKLAYYKMANNKNNK